MTLKVVSSEVQDAGAPEEVGTVLSLSCGWDPVTAAWLVGCTKGRRGQQRQRGTKTVTLTAFILNKMLAASYPLFKMLHMYPLLPLCLILMIAQQQMKMAPFFETLPCARRCCSFPKAPK